MHRVGQRWLFCVAVLLAALSPHATSVAPAQDDDGEDGTLVLDVDGSKIEIPTNLCYLLNTDSGYADGYELVGDGIFLTGFFDLNGDGRHGEEDKVEYDDDEEDVVPGSLLHKSASITPTAENPDVTITIAGLGECQVVGGSITPTAYKVNPSDTEDHWSGTIELVIKTPAGEERTLSGTFDSGITGVW